MKRILVVCAGNICRSPLGEAILRDQIAKIEAPISVDSAGTGNWHVGERSDYRAIRVGEARGYTMNHLARQIDPRDFEVFDLILAMDYANLDDLTRIAGAHKEKIRLIRSFDPEAEDEIVADPYYGTITEFEAIADQLEAACRGLVKWVVARGA